MPAPARQRVLHPLLQPEGVPDGGGGVPVLAGVPGRQVRVRARRGEVRHHGHLRAEVPLHAETGPEAVPQGGAGEAVLR